MELKQIGTIHSPYEKKSDAPRQGRIKDDRFVIEVFPEYAEGLKDIEFASHLFVLFWCDQAGRNKLTALPPGDKTERGVFATRSPARPNPVGIDVVDLVKREGNRLMVRKMDALNGSPLLDIKPYIGDVDAVPEAKLGWLTRETREKNCHQR